MQSGQKRVLMVEGRDDKHVAQHICGARSLGCFTDIRTYEGIDQLLESIRPSLKETNLISLGIVMDADRSLSDRWKAVSSRLEAAGISGVPASPASRGVVITEDANVHQPRVGVWVMPDNISAGILEDFLLKLIPPGDSLLPYATSSVSGIPPASQRFPEAKKSKALTHTWLAWQEKPALPFGLAIKCGYLDATASDVDDFAYWLARLLE